MDNLSQCFHEILSDQPLYLIRLAAAGGIVYVMTSQTCRVTE